MKHGCTSCLDDPNTVDHVYGSPPEMATPEPHLLIGAAIPGCPPPSQGTTSSVREHRKQSAYGCDPSIVLRPSWALDPFIRPRRCPVHPRRTFGRGLYARRTPMNT